MTTWRNWSGRHSVDVDEYRFVRSEEDLAGVVARATERGRVVRVAGAGHSHVPLVPNGDVIVDLSGLAGVVRVDPEARRAVVRAGTPIYALGRALLDAGLALANQGDIDRQLIGGAIGTGTHGTGRRLRNLSSMVISAQIITAEGSQLRCSSEAHPDVWEAVRLNLGGVGVVTEVELSVVPAFRLAERGWSAPYDEIRAELRDRPDQHRHFEFFWYPRRDTAVVKVIDETDSAPSYPLADEGERVGWSHEVLPNHRPDLHTEMEFSVPLDAGPECLDELRSMLQSEFPDLRWPVEYRTVAADDVWLSSAYHREVATISVHQGIDLDDRALFEASEAVFRRYEGRPHWGKCHFFTGSDFARSIPRWQDWWAVRNRLDPSGTFLNDYLRALAGDTDE